MNGCRIGSWLLAACVLMVEPAWAACGSVTSSLYRYSYGATTCTTLEEIEALMPAHVLTIYPGVSATQLASAANAPVYTSYRPNAATDPTSGALNSAPSSTTASFRLFAKNQPSAIHPSCTSAAPSCTSAGCGSIEDLRKLAECHFDATWDPVGGLYCWQRLGAATVTGTGFTRPPTVTGAGQQTATLFYGPSTSTSFDSGMTVSVAAQTCPTATRSGESAEATQPVPRTFNWSAANNSTATCMGGSTVGSGGGCSADYEKFGVEAPALTQTPGECGAGNPCFPGNGNKQVYEDGLRYGNIALDFTYNSLRQAAPLAYVDRNWSHSYARRIHTEWMIYGHYANFPGPEGGGSGQPLTPVQNIPGMMVQDERTQLEGFVAATPVGLFRSTATLGKYLRYVAGATPPQQSWQLDHPDGTRELYDRTGRLTAIIDPQDPRKSVTLSYGSTPSVGTLYNDTAVADPMFWRIVRITDGSGRFVTLEYENPPVSRLKRALADDGTELLALGYDTASRLVTLTRFGKTRNFVYNEPANIGVTGVTGYWLTGILDEDARRYATYTYDGSGRVTGSWHGTDAGKVIVQYPTDGQSIVTDPLGRQTQYNYHATQPYRKIANAVDNDGTVGLEYNAAHRVAARVDRRGARTEYEYSADGAFETARTEAVGTPEQRRTETDWDPTLKLRTAERVKASPPSGPVVTLKDKRYRYVAGTRRLAGIDEYDPASGAVRSINLAYCSAGDVANGATTNCAFEGQLASADGPRTDLFDITGFAYRIADNLSGCGTYAGPCWRKGDLWKTTNALGHVEQIAAYDRAGRIKRSVDANGVITDYTYDGRGWLTERTVRAAANGVANPSLDATTTYVYDGAGNVTRLYPPGGQGAYVDYGYDTAHRVTSLSDAFGNRIAFVLDKQGNRLSETIYDSGNVLRRSLGREYNALNRLVRVTNAAALPVLEFTETSGDMVQGYDANGNPRRMRDGRSVVFDKQYDPLNRLVAALEDYRAGSPSTPATANATTTYTYDAADHLKRVRDADLVITDYAYDGFDNLRGVTSADSGNRTYVYDAAGNLTQETDGRGVVTERAYDALNRLVYEHFPLSLQGLGTVLEYDQPDSVTNCSGSFPVGRLTQMSDAEGITTFCYDLRGNIVKKRVDTVWHGQEIRYEYTRGDQLKVIYYSDGSIVRYTRDQMRRISQVTWQADAASSPQTLVSGVSYYPFGPVKTLTFGNGRTLTKTYDADYRIDSVVSSHVNGLTLDLGVDAMGNVTSAASTLGGSPLRRYEYDNLGRLAFVKNNGGTALETYTYSKGGDRTGKTVGGISEVYAYFPSSHRLSSVNGVARGADANGNVTTGIAGAALVYDDYSRLAESPQLPGEQTPSLTRFNYNAKAQRVRKFDHRTRNDVWYSESGLRLADIDYTRTCSDMRKSGTAVNDWPVEICPGGGLLLTELVRRVNYVYLADMPIAVVEYPSGASAAVYYVETDHLGTPRNLVEPATNAIKWQWDFFASAFGEHAPVVPGGGVRLDMRYPGQFYDVETGLHYNNNRDYEPRTGRYVESDPIGLLGGGNTYSYAKANPLSLFDLLGLDTVLILTTEHLKGPRAWARAAEYAAAQAKKECEKCDIVSADVNRVSQMQELLNSYSDIQKLVIIGHSGPRALYFGTESGPGTNLASWLASEGDVDVRTIDWGGLKPNATIDLVGCRNGQGENSIAEAIARLSQRRVFGTSDKLNFDESTGEPFFRWYRPNATFILFIPEVTPKP